jgi:hypothetical protein
MMLDGVCLPAASAVRAAVYTLWALRWQRLAALLLHICVYV